MIRSTTKYGWMAAALLLVGFLPAAHATTLASLNDWCFNVDGVNVVTNLCNTGQTSVTFPSGVNGSSFDFTLGSQTEGTPSTPYSGMPTTVNDQNTLGSVTITLSPGANQYVLAYMDYDLNYNAQGGSFSDFASTNGAQAVANATSVNYSLNDPNACTGACSVSDIFDQFSGNTLDNTNHVGGYSVIGHCCDVSWALGLNIDVAANTQDVVTFAVSNIAPRSGFYLQQANGLDNSQNIYMQALVTVVETGGPTVPEPASWVLIGGGLAGALLLRKRMAKAQSDLA